MSGRVWSRVTGTAHSRDGRRVTRPTGLPAGLAHASGVAGSTRRPPDARIVRARHPACENVTKDLYTHTVTRYLDNVTNEVRRLREERGLSQGQLATELRVSRQTINAIETGRYLPSLPLAFTIARYFGRSLEEIFHDDGHATL